MNLPSKADPLHPAARKGIKLFNEGEFYEAHEHLELAWMNTRSPERDLYQGILQVGLAYFQISKGNYRGALKMLKRCRKNLGPLGDNLLGINIRQLLKDANQVETEIRKLGPEQLHLFDQSLIRRLPKTLE